MGPCSQGVFHHGVATGFGGDVGGDGGEGRGLFPFERYADYFGAS